MAAAPRPETSLYTTPPPPRYESIVSADALNKLSQSPYFDIARKISYGNTSDNDGVQSSGVSIFSKISFQASSKCFILFFRLVFIHR